MRAVVGFPSYSSITTWSSITGTWDANYPVTNLADLLRLRRVAKATSSGAVALSFTLASAQTIGLVSLAHHNLSALATVRLRLYSDVLTTEVYDSGLISPPAPVANYAQMLPMLIPIPRAALTGRLDITPYSGDPDVLLGAVDVAQAYLWSDVTTSQQRGFVPSGQRIAQAGGGDANMRQWSPRTFIGERDVVTRAEIESTILDFQKYAGLSNPFAFVRDIDDPTVWPRESYLARNKPISNSVINGPENGKHAFAFNEHLG